jgi:hypothetical protein
MKTCMPVIMVGICVGMLNAAPPTKSPAETKPDQDLGEVRAEKPVKLEKRVTKEEAWAQARYGVLGQFVQAPSVLAPINPVAKPEAGSGEGNLSRDTVTGRVMGLCLVKFDF